MWEVENNHHLKSLKPIYLSVLTVPALLVKHMAEFHVFALHALKYLFFFYISLYRFHMKISPYYHFLLFHYLWLIQLPLKPKWNNNNNFGFKHQKITTEGRGVLLKMLIYYQNCSFIFQKYPFVSWNCPFIFQKCLFISQ